MRSTTSLMLGIAFGAALFVPPLAWADGRGPCRGGEGYSVSQHGGSPHGRMTAHMLRNLLRHKQELGLTDDQIAKLRTLALDADRARIRADADVLVSKRELRALLWDDKAELSAIEAKIREHEALEATARIIGVRAKRELMGVLSPEQRGKQKAIWEEHRQDARRPMGRAEAEGTIDERREGNGDTATVEIETSELNGSLSPG